MFLEFDALIDFVGGPVDLVKNISADNCMYRFLFSLLEAVNRSTCFVDSFRLTILSSK